MRKKSYAYRIMYPYPMFKKGGYLDRYLMAGGGDIPAMTSLDMSAAYMPKAAETMSPVNNQLQTGKNNSAINMGTVGSVAGVAGGVFNSLAANNTQNNPYRSNLPGNSTAQQTVDSVASVLPFYSVGKSVGNLAKSDYQTQNEFGELTDTDKFTTAETIGTFIDPLSSFISGLSGEGWTAKQKAEKINASGAENRMKYKEMKAAQYKQREINSGHAGNYWDLNNSMQAAYGGSLPGPGVIGESYAKGGYIERYGATRADLPQISNYNSGINTLEDGGKIPQVTEYNVGGEHSENQSGYGGIPVDAQGNKSIVSGNKPTAVTEEGELSWWNSKKGSAYVFSNKLFV